VVIENSPETKKPAGGGRAVDDRLLADQSRHRAARVDERHQKRAVGSAAKAFRCAIGAFDTGGGGWPSSLPAAIPVDAA
jgi:hypothetical protein